MSEKINIVISKIVSYLDERDAVREEVVKESREIIRLSKKVLRHVREENYHEARKTLDSMEKQVASLIEKLKPYPELLYSGLVYNAISEYAEARVVLDILDKESISGYEDLQIPPVPYLQGVADSVGELRRLVLINVKKRDLEKAWRLFKWMESITETLQQLEYPEALIPGVRRKVDIARRLVDETLALLVDIEARGEKKSF